MTKTYSARPRTRITQNAGARLRQPAPIRRQRLSHVPGDVPGAALPATEDLAAQPSRLTTPGREARHGSS